MINSKGQLRKDLTFEEFCALASRKPSLDGEWVYRYESFEIPEFYAENLYPDFELLNNDSILFHLFEAAEEFMRYNIANNFDSFRKLYCHCITQLPIGEQEWRPSAQWLYAPDGKLVDFTPMKWVGNVEDHCFFGRSADRQRFQKGSIVEVRIDSRVRLGVVWSPEMSVYECWAAYQRSIKENTEYPIGMSEDCCIVVFGSDFEDFDHVPTINIMEPHHEVDESLSQKMREYVLDFERTNTEDEEQ